MRSTGVMGAALAAGLLAGAVLDLLARNVARYGAAGNGWSSRGNGALAVPLGLGSAGAVSGGAAILALVTWSALRRRRRSRLAGS